LSREEPEKKSGTTPHGREVNEPPEPPVEEGERREVEIEDIGDQGDGITRVERGFVVIVPETKPGDRVTIEIADVQQNVAFAEVLA
jgi:predicted RNA-binding protein with TRAM domain